MTTKLETPQAVETDEYFAEVYNRLKTMASRQKNKGRDFSLSTTEIVHELYLRMDRSGKVDFSHAYQFFSYAAQAMRSIVVDLARQKMQQKKGGDLRRIALTDPAAGAVEIDTSLALALDAGLRALELDDQRAARVVELHFFAGLDLDRVGQLLGIARRTVDRDWRYARAFLASFA